MVLLKSSCLLGMRGLPSLQCKVRVSSSPQKNCPLSSENLGGKAASNCGDEGSVRQPGIQSQLLPLGRRGLSSGEPGWLQEPRETMTVGGLQLLLL